ncbi:hypothetical protein ACMD2_03528 [Ananas comosus]|uniref:Uncharacterized protein n=1 Tax=Ananas comosus TaxID=4615 RepID=A0A199VI40_ANACO|nr:hypothetical protein ACMD2_03528 [Ananas comosus]
MVMGWWDRIVFPMRRVWIGVASRLGMRKSGLSRLRYEVSTCEYEDVRVMWEMLSRTDGEIGVGRRGRRRHRTAGKRPHVWAVLDWARRGPSWNFCRSF